MTYHLPTTLSISDVEILAATLLDIADALGFDIEAHDNLTSADVADLAALLAHYDLPAVRLAVLDVTAPDSRRAKRENFRRLQMRIRQRRRQQRRRQQRIGRRR